MSRSTVTQGTASLPFTASTGSQERRLSVFEMLHKNAPRTPDSSRHSSVWQVTSLGEGSEDDPPPPATGRRARLHHPVLADTKSSIASRGLPVPIRPPTPDHLNLLPNNSQEQAERHYVKSSRLKDNPVETFTHQIMQNFFKAPKARGRGYGMPRPDTREGSATGRLMMIMSRKPSFVRVPSHVSLCQPVRCQCHRGVTEEYCEILGPGVCSSCIETTNRHIAEEIQRRLFPEIEVTQSCLVVPALTKVMKDGHVKQVRRRRLQELRTSEPGFPPNHRSRQPRLHSRSLVVWGPKNNLKHRLPPLRNRSETSSSLSI
ncbi:hypothetical protein BaRGS_00025439 [Batillaria attramentaria]|uniref:Uncharacterized protein n=1 Tax=Batillaria attramentaria TaxID=370345 RepID=A0ABD0K859_9CAEN